MARFYANVQGSRGEATRMGTPASGITAHIRGWDVGIQVDIQDVNGSDVCYVYKTGGSNGRVSRELIGTFTQGPGPSYG